MEKRVNVDRLKPGVFVARLDRPWLETPFLLQGFLVRSWDDVEQLKGFCKEVYIDPERGDDVSDEIVPGPAVAAGPLPRAMRVHRAATAYQLEFHEEIERALEVHRDARKLVDEVLQDVRMGRSVDVAATKRVVEQLAASVMRNPDALLLLNQLRRKDEYTGRHSINVCILALAFGRYVGLEEPELHVLGTGALLHDVGKMKMPPELLAKAAPLTPEEFAIMQGHVAAGVQILAASSGVDPGAVEVVENHHERYNGSGYPRGLRGERIGRYGLIGGIVDVYDALTSTRPYGEAVTSYEALKHLYQHRKKDFDETLALQFIQCIGIYPVGSLVELNTGHVGFVTSVHPKHRLQPTVLVVLDNEGQRYPSPIALDLLNQGMAMGARPLEVKGVVSPAKFGIDPADYFRFTDVLTRKPTSATL